MFDVNAPYFGMHRSMVHTFVEYWRWLTLILSQGTLKGELTAPGIGESDGRRDCPTAMATFILEFEAAYTLKCL